MPGVGTRLSHVKIDDKANDEDNMGLVWELALSRYTSTFLAVFEHWILDQIAAIKLDEMKPNSPTPT